MSGARKATADFLVGVLVVAGLYLVARPGSKSAELINYGGQALRDLVFLVTGPI